MNKLNLALSLALGAITLAGCSSKMDANEKNFGAAINQGLSQADQACLYHSLGFGMGGIPQWPIDVPATNKTGKELEALLAVGLISVSDAEVTNEKQVEVGMFKYKNVKEAVKIKRYSLTDLAKKYQPEKSSNICYGKMSIDKIVKWEGPRKDGDYQEALVTYTYQIKDQADWSKNPQIQSAFVGVRRTIEGAGKQEQVIAVKLTSQGWEPK